MTEGSRLAALRSRADFERVAPEVVRRAAAFPTAVLADVTARRNAFNGRIAPLVPTMRVAGPAFTVEVKPGDNLMVHTAIALARPGDVLVIDGKDDRSCALVGGIMANTCIAVGVAGLVVDGATRDVDEICELGFPVFCHGSNPNGPSKLAPGRIGETISAGERVVRPGDLIVGDADGVVVIERELAESVLVLAERKVAAENARVAELRAGRKLVPDWLEEALRSAGLPG